MQRELGYYSVVDNYLKSYFKRLKDYLAEQNLDSENFISAYSGINSEGSYTHPQLESLINYQPPYFKKDNHYTVLADGLVKKIAPYIGRMKSMYSGKKGKR